MPRRLLAFAAVVMTTAVAVGCGTGAPRAPVPQPTWRTYTQLHWGFTLTYAAPFAVDVDRAAADGWHVRLAVPPAAGRVTPATGAIAIDVRRLHGRRPLTARRLVLRAPALTGRFLSQIRAAGGPPVLLVQPYEQTTLNNVTTIEMVYERYQRGSGSLVRFDRQLIVVHGLLYTVVISGDRRFWDRLSVTAKEAVGTLVFFVPQA